MNLPEINKNNIQDYLDKEEIIRATIQQIMKDFGMFGVDITFLGEIKNAYSEIHAQLTYQVEGLFQTNLSKLYAVLYQVDISNKAIEDAQKEMPEYSLIEVIAHQIVQRDLQKVLMRKYFSSMNN
ncbi:MAG: hypothetical protein PF517_04480 [Salinivirgaceae bacterium]|jgi:hypothetical protein|nr:hypothetical protein [Salinivirgaceae bacterium]